jgi:hypothetical protein
MKKVSINYKYFYNNFCFNGATRHERDNRNLRNGFTDPNATEYFDYLSYFGILYRPKGSKVLEVIETSTSCREVLAKQWYLCSCGSYGILKNNTNISYQNIPLSFKDTVFGEDRDIFLAISFSKKNFERFSKNIKLLTSLEKYLKAENSEFMVEDFNDSTTRDVDYITVAVSVSKYWTRSTILFSIFTLLLRDLVWIITPNLKLKDLFAGRFDYIRNFNYKSTNLKVLIDQRCLDLRKFLKNSDYILGNEPHTGVNDSSWEGLYTGKHEPRTIHCSDAEFAAFPKINGLSKSSNLRLTVESAYYNGIMALSRYYNTILLDGGRLKEIHLELATNLGYGLLWLLRYERLLEMEKKVKDDRKEKRAVHKELELPIV